MVARILSGLVGAIMLISAINWIIDPAAAAAGLEIKESYGSKNIIWSSWCSNAYFSYKLDY
jgi:hypothetical protein